jgi:hypothetical protein
MLLVQLVDLLLEELQLLQRQSAEVVGKLRSDHVRLQNQAESLMEEAIASDPVS